MYKCISLPGSPYGAGHNSALRFNDGNPNGNVASVQETNTTWLRLWIRWDLAQPNPASDLPSAFAALNQSEHLLQIDAEVARANQIQCGVILALDSFYPLWANGLSPSSPVPQPQYQTPNGRFPKSVTANSPYGWFIAYLLARYHANVPPNGGVGPGQGTPATWWGNPSGARIHFLDVVNEPNFLHWPQWDPANGTSSARVAGQMMITAEACASAYSNCGIGAAPGILGPSSSDNKDDAYVSFGGDPNFLVTRNVFDFSADVANTFETFRWGPGISSTPRAYVAWAHHNYQDIEDGPQTSGRWRAEQAFAAARSYGWWDPNNVFLTEGTRRIFTRYPTTKQFKDAASTLALRWNAMKTALPQAYLFTQHTINDHPLADVKYGMRGEAANNGPPSTQKRPMYSTWQGLS